MPIVKQCVTNPQEGENTKRYKLHFAKEVLSLNGEVKLYQDKSQSDHPLQLYALHNEGLDGYQYDNNTWTQILSLKGLRTQKIYFDNNMFENGELTMIAKTLEGISFYQCKRNEFSLLNKTENFRNNTFSDTNTGSNESKHIVEFGHFYQNQKLLGILTHQKHIGTNLYTVLKSLLQKNEYPIVKLKWTISSNSLSQAKFALSDLKHSGQENIIVHDDSGLNIYWLNGSKSNKPELLMQVPSSAKSDDSEEGLYFPNLTGQSYRDIVVLNTSGLFVFQYNSSVSNYILFDYQPSFSKLKGWKQENVNSIQFEDINSDGREDMLVTAPEGINLLSFNNHTNQWQSLLDNSELTISQSHSSVVSVLCPSPSITKYPIVFTKYNNQLHWANVVEIENSLMLEEELELQTVHSTSSQIPTLKILPQVAKIRFEEEKPTLLLRDELDYTGIMDAVNKITGKLSFKLPLIDLSNLSSDLKLDLFYDGNSQISGDLGYGWSLPQNYIMMNHQASIFPEDAKYYIILQDLPLQLVFISKNSTDNVYSFEISNGQSDVQLHYYRDKEIWEIDSKGVKQIYGSDQNDAIVWGLKWKNWRGVGSSLTGQEKFVNVWYLAKVEDKNNNALHYTYDSIEVNVAGGQNFTREIYLRTISDNQSNNITFNYSNKDKSEYDLPPLIDQEGNLNTKMVQTRYLSGYNLSCQQNINFVYEVKDGKRFLSKIEQEGDPTNQPVLKFSYSQSHILGKVVLPNGVAVEFDYQLLEQDSFISINEKIGQSYDVGKNHRVDYGNNYVLVSYMDGHGQVVLRMFNPDMTVELYSSWNDTSKLPLLGRGAAQSYKVVLIEDFLVVFLYYDYNQEIHLLHQKEGKWLVTYYTFEKKAILKPGKDFVAVIQNDSPIEVISCNKNTKEWRKDKLFVELEINKAPLLVQVFGRGIIFYSNDILYIGYKNCEDLWRYNKIKSIPDVIGDIEQTIDKFNLDITLRNDLFTTFKNYGLQVSNNLLILNRWKAEEMRIYSVIDLLVLDSNYNIAKHDQKKVLLDDLNQISDWYEVDDGISFKLVYEHVDKKFKLVAKDICGHILDKAYKEVDEKTDNGNKSNNGKNHIKQEFLKNATKSLEDPTRKPFLLNYNKYLAVLQSQVVIRNNTMLTFTGNDWKEGTLSEEKLRQLKLEEFSIPLDKEVVLKKENINSSLRLFKKRNNIEEVFLDLGVKELDQVVIRYPVYLAYQKIGNPIKVVKFANNGSIHRIDTLPWGERLNPFSNSQILVTSIDKKDDTKTLVFREQLGHIFPNPVTTKVTVSFDGNERISGYEYSEAKVLGNIICYENVSILPGNDKSSFGWIEETRHSEIHQNKFFNSKGELIKTLKIEDRKTSANDTIGLVDQENLYLHTSLLDKTGRLEIVNFFPHKITDEEVSYYGFEDYEMNKIGEKNSASEKKWVFDEKDIVRDGFSLTGRNYLSLSGTSLIGKFEPYDQIQEYIASCWMRPKSEMFNLGDIVPYLKAVVSVENKNETVLPLGEVKLQLGNWFYLEVIIDLFYAKKILKNLNELQTNKTLIEKENVTLSTTIVVAPGINTTIDIDHIRFSPLRSSFEANVYDIKSKQVIEVISSSGLIERKIYDKYQKQVGSVSGYGELMEFRTYTKATSIGRMTDLKCNVLIQPKNGFYEDFSSDSFSRHWKIDNAEAWQISPSTLEHLDNNLDTLQLNSSYINHSSCGIRFYFSLKSKNAEINFNNNLKAIHKGNRAEIEFSGRNQFIPFDGELLIVVEGKRVFVWIDGGLYFDSPLDVSIFNLQIRGQAKISELIVFSQPNVEVTYFNKLNEKIQQIVLESENFSTITQYLYDELGRSSITTQSARIERHGLAYYPNFVTNNNPYTANSVWKTGKLEGDVVRMIGEYSYSQIKYCNNTLNEKCAVGLPGKEFSVWGPYGKHFSSSLNDSFITNLFPSKDHSYQVEHKPGDVKDISVFDSSDNRVAWYISTPGKINSKSLLSTYKYNENGKLVKILPPAYHEKVGTFYHLNSQLNSSFEEQRILQDLFGVNISYDQRGNIVTKTSPDSGKIENIYNEYGFLKFSLHYSKNETLENIIYFDYDEQGRLKSKGKVISPTPKEKLLSLELLNNNTRVYQEFYYNNAERQPVLRGKVARTITFDREELLLEESVVNIDEETISKRIIIPTKESENPLLITVNKWYEAGKLREVEYPVDIQDSPLRIKYQYDKLGRVESIGIKGKENLFASFTYNAFGQISSEVHLPDVGKNLTRQYSYNSAGFLMELKDRFLTEKVYYTEGSYGSHGYGDGTITSTKFEATWHGNCDTSKLGLNERSFVNGNITPKESELCFRKLKEAGYLNDSGLQTKIYYSELETNFPFICGYGPYSRYIQNTLGREGFPREYGHSYDYGNYQELTKAKYFVGSKVPMPLQPDSFAKQIVGINQTASYDIWEKLKNSEYLFEDNEKVDVSSSYGKRVRGKSFIQSKLLKDAEDLNASYKLFIRSPLERLLVQYFSQKQDLLSLRSSLEEVFAGVNDNIANKILGMLEKKRYLQNPIAEEFSEILKQYQPFIRDIIRVLSEHFAKELGEGEFDVQSYNIDKNGNHRHFYTGFDRYEISYHNNTNQINNVNFNSFASFEREKDFLMKHDSRGNVIQALHKGIERIDYHPISNRATEIKLMDGRVLQFYYDARGERVIKRVCDKAGKTTKEIHYVRDEFGRVLAEREVTYVAGDLRPDVSVTAYIYGPRGLFGFIRGNEFYSLITDHEYSIRLVVKGDEVVAAYDYLPYGNLMRKYENNPKGQISYRYNGQEWDEEIGLYNYHARFYDPCIGRFYQTDPKEQYFSPYKYAGNSPVSMVDPNGEFAFLALLPLIVAGAVVGIYLGGAAANDKWDPTEWDFKSKETWLGIIGGGIAGGFLPVGFAGSVGALTIGLSIEGAVAITTGLGLGAGYLAMASANNAWYPGQWDLKSPETWNAGFHGFALGSSIVAGGHGATMAFQKLASVGSKGAFIGGVAAVFGGSFVKSGFDNQWDFSKPGLYYGGLQAFDDATNLPVFARSAFKSLNKGGMYMISGQKYASRAAVKMALKVLGVSVPAIVLTALNEGMDISKPETYFSIARYMAMVNQNWLIGKPFYKTYKIRKELKFKEQVESFSHKVVDDILTQYRQDLEYTHETDSYKAGVELYIGKLKEIPGPSQVKDVDVLIAQDVAELYLERLNRSLEDSNIVDDGTPSLDYFVNLCIKNKELSAILEKSRTGDSEDLKRLDAVKMYLKSFRNIVKVIDSSYIETFSKAVAESISVKLVGELYKNRLLLLEAKGKRTRDDIDHFNKLVIESMNIEVLGLMYYTRLKKFKPIRSTNDIIGSHLDGLAKNQNICIFCNINKKLDEMYPVQGTGKAVELYISKLKKITRPPNANKDIDIPIAQEAAELYLERLDRSLIKESDIVDDSGSSLDDFVHLCINNKELSTVLEISSTGHPDRDPIRLNAVKVYLKSFQNILEIIDHSYIGSFSRAVAESINVELVNELYANRSRALKGKTKITRDNIDHFNKVVIESMNIDVLALLYYERLMRVQATGRTDDIIRLHFEELAKTQKIFILHDADNNNNMVEGTQKTESTSGSPKIGNRAIAIAMSDMHTSVAFSGNKGTGFIAFYDHNTFKELTQGRYYLQKDNKFIAEERVVLSSIPKDNESLIDRISKFQEDRKKSNMKEFKEMIRDTTDDNILGDLDNNEALAVMTELRKDLNNNVQPNRKFMMDKILEIYKRLPSSDIIKFSDSISKKKIEISRYEENLKSISKETDNLQWREKYSSIEKQIAKLEKGKITNKEKKTLDKLKGEMKKLQDSDPKSYKIIMEVENFIKEIDELQSQVGKENNEAKKNELQKQLENLNKEREGRETFLPFKREFWRRKIQVLNKEVADLNSNLLLEEKNVKKKLEKSLEKSELLKKIRELDKNLTPWTYNNCAEPHCTSLFDRSREAFLDEPFGGEIKFMATYKNLNLGEQLEGFPRCDNCVISTERIQSIITDPDWLGMMEGLRAQLDIQTTKLNAPKNIPHFLLPITNRSLEARNSSSVRRKRSVLVSQGKEETMPDPQVRAGKLSISNQLNKDNMVHINKKIDNNVIRTFSWINDLFNQAKSSVGRLLYSRIIPVEERLKTTPSSITQVDTSMDVNGTIILFDVLIRKVTGQKYISTTYQNVSLLEAQSFVLNIEKEFDKVIEQAALKSGISMYRLNIDYVGMQKQIIEKIQSGKFNEIPDVLTTYIKKACPDREAGYPGRLSPKKFDRFIEEFNRSINVVLDQLKLQIDGVSPKPPNSKKNNFFM